MNLRSLGIDRSWTLFLDRDGVINRRIVNGYVRNWEEFEFLPGVTGALALLAPVFSRIIVVSNQQGVGKGLMTHADVDAIHHRMTEEVARAGGRFDAVYFAPFLATDRSVMRKPGIGMALRARREFPGVRFRYSLMAGDSLSDMQFGKRAGMTTVLIADQPSLARAWPSLIDFRVPDLEALAQTIIPG